MPAIERLGLLCVGRLLRQRMYEKRGSALDGAVFATIDLGGWNEQQVTFRPELVAESGIENVPRDALVRVFVTPRLYQGQLQGFEAQGGEVEFALEQLPLPVPSASPSRAAEAKAS